MTTKKQPAKPKQTGAPEYEGTFRVLEQGDGDPLAEIMAENLVGDDGFGPGDLTRVTFPREGDAWQFEDAGQKRIEAEIVGVPLRQQITRAFHIKPYEAGSNDAPDCRSQDGVHGTVQLDENGQAQNLILDVDGNDVAFGGLCMRCPLNQWESAQRIGKQGKGKACTEYRVLAVLEPESEWPLMVRLPPTQIRHWVDFTKSLVRHRVRISDSVVSLGIDDGQLAPALVGRVPSDVAKALRESVGAVLQLASPQEVVATLAAPDDDDPGPLEGGEGPF